MKRKWKEILNNNLAILPSHDSGNNSERDDNLYNDSDSSWSRVTT